MTLFYSQNCEDVLLARCFEGQQTGFYVDVGAEDPDAGSVTRYFYERGWRGLNIEPTPYFWNQLQLARPRDLNLQLAASNTDHDTVELTVVQNTGLSSIDAERRLMLAGQQTHAVESIEVQTRRLDTLLEWANLPRIDFLKVDVEGHELSVMQGINLLRFRPRVIVIETTEPLIHPGGRVEMAARPVPARDLDAINHLIVEAGYQNVYFDGLNTWWIDANEPQLATVFATPANVFDTVSPMQSYRVETKLIAHIQQLRRAREGERRVLRLQNAQLREQQRQLFDLDRRLQRIVQSPYWKLSAPLRWLLRRLRRPNADHC